MMIDAPALEMVAVAVVVENERATVAGIAATQHLRQSGLSAELYATGSPRKRRDRAVKRGASEILTLDVDGEQVSTRLSGGTQAGTALKDFTWPEPTSA